MGAFVTIHGIDGTGKTTIARNIPEAFRNSYTGSYCFDDLAMPAETVIPAAAGKYERSVLKKIGQSAIVRGIVEADGFVVKDRWMIDVAASNSFANGGRYTVNPEGVLMPDLSVLLTCNETERMRRIHARGNPTPDDLIPNEPGTRAYYFEHFLYEHLPNFAQSHIVIDTTATDLAAVTEQIRGALPHVTRL